MMDSLETLDSLVVRTHHHAPKPKVGQNLLGGNISDLLDANYDIPYSVLWT